jgi:hypothetical protein
MSTSPSPFTADLSQSTPLQVQLKVLDLGQNPSLAWTEPAETAFASSINGTGYAKLYDL